MPGPWATWVFAGAVIYAPLAFGCTTPATLWGLDILLLLGFLLWVGHKVRRREGVRVRPLALLLNLGLALLAVAQLLNPRFEFEPTSWTLRPLDQALPLLPGTWDRAASLACFWHLLTLGLAFVAVTDLAATSASRWRLLAAIALSGTIVAVLGMFQKAAQAQTMPWGHDPERLNLNFFGAFQYHGNAAAFLNLCWPAAVALFLRQEKTGWGWQRSVWTVAFAVTFGGLFVNLSKFGHVMALPALLLAAWVFRKDLPPGWWRLSPLTVVAPLILIAVVGFFAIPSLAASLERWNLQLETAGSRPGRLLTYQVCLDMVRDAGWFGTGPGTFRLLYPFYSITVGDTGGRWTYAHQDYLQAAIEWGWVGVALWLGLLGIPWLRPFVASRLSQAAAWVGLFTVYAHSLIDFPLQIGAIQWFAAVYLAILWRQQVPHK